MKIFNFELEKKLELHIFNLKFDGECNGDGPKAQKPYLNPQMTLIDPLKAKKV